MRIMREATEREEKDRRKKPTHTEKRKNNSRWWTAKVAEEMKAKE